MNYTVAVTGTGFSGSGTTVTAAANSATLTRTGTATYTQATSGKSQGVSLSQAAAAPITVSPTAVFSNMTSPDIGQSYATTITVSNCPTKPTVSITMEEQLDNVQKHQMGNAGNSEPVFTGNNTWTFKVWPKDWYLATDDTGIVIPGWHCLGEVTVTLTIENSATVSIRGYVPIDF